MLFINPCNDHLLKKASLSSTFELLNIKTAFLPPQGVMECHTVSRSLVHFHRTEISIMFSVTLVLFLPSGCVLCKWPYLSNGSDDESGQIKEVGCWFESGRCVRAFRLIRTKSSEAVICFKMGKHVREVKIRLGKYKEAVPK